MSSSTSRRLFLLNTGKAGLAAYFAAYGSSVLTSCAAPAKVKAGTGFTTGFQQQPLPYAYNALNEAVDAQTMEIHYSKHAAAYATNLNDAAKAEGVDTGKPLEDVLRRISKYSAKMRNNGGGHYNHTMFWEIMKPGGGGEPTGALAEAAVAGFGGFPAMREVVNSAGLSRFGSGWTWLVLTPDGQLAVLSTQNQDNPLMDGSGFPVLGIDVWEHAYYLKYQNKRGDYLNAWWNTVNWDAVNQRFERARGGQ